MPNDIYQVDAFADKPFSGNPAGVVPLKDFVDDSRMLAIAAEMNLAETAFVVPRNNHFDLRWFTPTVEVDLCGHATLATAHILWETDQLPAGSEAVFQSRSGKLVARQTGNEIELTFPTLSVVEANPPANLIEGLGVTPVFVGISKFDYLVQVASAAEVRNLQPDMAKLAVIDARGAIVTAASDDARFDFISRFFAPSAGIPEDPVTGSAHCVLGAFWQSRLGRSTLRAYQASPRGGSMTVRVDGDRTYLSGRAVTVIRGQLLV